MEISVPKTKVMVVSAVSASAVNSTCNDNPVEQVATFKYLGLHFHQSGSIAHLVTPIKARAGGSWAAVQRRHSLMQCGNTVNLHLRLCKLFWCLPYNMGVRSGVCIALAPSLTQAFTDRQEAQPLAFASVLVAPNSAILE